MSSLKWVAIPLLFLCAACSSAALPPAVAPPDAAAQAAAQATAIIQQAQATALLLKAQAQATALIEKALTTPTVVVVDTLQPTPNLDLTATTQPSAPGQTLPAPPFTPTAPGAGKEIVIYSVSLAAKGAYVQVKYTAIPRLANSWTQGTIYVINEKTGKKYEFIPVVPILGALFAKPTSYGQIAYVMFANLDPPLLPGESVTVVLGTMKKTGMIVEDGN
jgi:type II secretory pathway pseudopilin PulG